MKIHKETARALGHIRTLLTDGEHPQHCDAHDEKGKADPNRCSIHHEFRTEAKRAANEFLDKLEVIEKHWLELVQPTWTASFQIIVPADGNGTVRLDCETGTLYLGIPRKEYGNLGFPFTSYGCEHAFLDILRASVTLQSPVEHTDKVNPTLSFVPNKEYCTALSVNLPTLPFEAVWVLELEFDYWGRVKA